MGLLYDSFLIDVLTPNDDELCSLPLLIVMTSWMLSLWLVEYKLMGVSK
jgi:hypothetical protein